MTTWLTDLADYMPHGMCLNWQPGLMALHIASDALIALAYFAIPFGIAFFVRRRTDLDQRHKLLAIFFALFITACGGTHVLSILVLWYPYYGAEGLLKAFTALVSVGTAVALPFLIPQLLNIPSPRVLEAEIRAHRETLNELEAARSELSKHVERTEANLADTTRRFETALKDSQVTVFEQDEDLRYSWIYNPGAGLSEHEILGRTDKDIFDSESAEILTKAKRRVLLSGDGVRFDVCVTAHDTQYWFDLRVERMAEGQRAGVVATANDITALKRQEEHLRVVTRELNHRSKNLLTIVLSLARQTARPFDVPHDYLTRLQERLAALSSAHDVLARAEWKGAELRSVIEGQLRYQLDTFPDRIRLTGVSCTLPAETAHYVGLAVHELGSNAVKYGALSEEEGRVEISWIVEESAGRPLLTLSWVERGGPTVAAPFKPGFGTSILTRLTPSAVDGTANLSYEANGVSWVLKAPIQSVALDSLLQVQP
jgi:PAS domain S-box-containing protein